MERERHAMDPHLRTNVIYTRLICSAVSICSCLIIIVIYIILFIKLSINNEKVTSSNDQSQSPEKNKYKHKSQYSSQKYEYSLNPSESFISGAEDRSIKFKGVNRTSKLTNTIHRNKKKQLGIGNHLMVFLIIAHLGWCTCSFLGISKLEGFILESDKRDTLCIAQAFTQNFFDMSAICWISMISKLLLRSTHGISSDFQNVQGEILVALAYSNFFPLFFAICPIFTDSYGPAITYCSIDILNIDWRTYLWFCVIYFFTWLNIGFNIYAFISASIYFARRAREIKEDKLRDREVKFLWKSIFIMRLFPMILVLSRIPKTANKLYTLFTGNYNPILLYAQTITTCLMGFCYSILCACIFKRVFANDNDQDNHSTCDSFHSKIMSSEKISSINEL